MQVLQRLQSAYIPSGKIILVVRATTHAPRGVPLHQNGTSFLPLLLWVVQTYGNHLGQGLVSMVDEEDTQNAGLSLLQLLCGQCGVLHCHVAKGHLMTAIHVALIWLQAEDDFLGDLSMMH